MAIRYPNEPAAYRDARQALLAEEVALRHQIEKVAALRRKLPQGGALAQDYTFQSLDGKPVRLSELFGEGRDTLALYSLMFRSDAAAPCPMCVSMLDGLAGQAGHVEQRVNLTVVAAATPAQLQKLADDRGWSGLHMVSAQGTSYQRDYLAEGEDGAQWPMMNIFRKTPGGIFHFWGSESFYAEIDGQPRHIDQIWPLWNLFDLTPEGRGTEWYPALAYAD